MTQRTVLIKSTPEGPIQKEWPADVALRPGMLVEYASGGTSIQALSATIDAVARVVIESGTVPVDGTYAAGDNVPFIVPPPGHEVYAYATAAALSTIPATTVLVSDGAGFLMSTGTVPVAVGEAVAVALEDITIAAGAIEQLKVEIL